MWYSKLTFDNYSSEQFTRKSFLAFVKVLLQRANHEKKIVLTFNMKCWSNYAFLRTCWYTFQKYVFNWNAQKDEILQLQPYKIYMPRKYVCLYATQSILLCATTVRRILRCYNFIYIHFYEYLTFQEPKRVLIFYKIRRIFSLFIGNATIVKWQQQHHQQQQWNSMHFNLSNIMYPFNQVNHPEYILKMRMLHRHFPFRWN